MMVDPHWRISKEIPLGLILSIAVFALAQTAAFSWWGATLSARVGELERANAERSAQAERIVRLESKMDHVAETLSDIRKLLGQRVRLD